MVGNWKLVNKTPILANMMIRNESRKAKSLAPLYVDDGVCLGTNCDFKIIRLTFDNATLQSVVQFPNNTDVAIAINKVSFTNSDLNEILEKIIDGNGILYATSQSIIKKFFEQLCIDSSVSLGHYSFAVNQNGYTYSGYDLVCYGYLLSSYSLTINNTTHTQLINSSYKNICTHIAGVSGGCAGEKVDEALPKSNIMSVDDLPLLLNNCNPFNCGTYYNLMEESIDKPMCLKHCPVNAIKYKLNNAVSDITTNVSQMKEALDVNFKKKIFFESASTIADEDTIRIIKSNGYSSNSTFTSLYNWILSKDSSLITGNTIVKRDSNGDFEANEITSNLIGNSSTSDYSNKSNYSIYSPRSPFKTVFIARRNGDNYDNSPNNYILCTSATDTILTLNELPREFLNNLSGEWGIYYLNQTNAKKITGYNVKNKTVTISSGGSSFANNMVFLVCYSNIGVRLTRDSNELIESNTSIESLFKFNTGSYIELSQAFIESGTNYLVLLIYMQENGTKNWSPHYIKYSISDSTLTRVAGEYGACLAPQGTNIILTGKPYETSLYLYFPILKTSSPYKYTFMIYNKSTKAYSISPNNILADHLSDPDIKGAFYSCPNYIGYDGKYHYMTFVKKNNTPPISEGYEEWMISEFRSTNSLSGYTDERIIVKSYDTWGCEHNYPDSTYTFKNNGNTYLAISSTAYQAKSGLNSNREYAIYKRISFGVYERDLRSPLIINPLYSYKLGLMSFNGQYQNYCLGGGLAGFQYNGNYYLLYTSESETNSYGIFGVIKNELLEESQL